MGAPKNIRIYALADVFGAIRYVGQTGRTLEQRLANHLKDAKLGSKIACHAWIRDLIACGELPAIHLLQEVPAANRLAAEREAISRLRTEGASLLNVNRKEVSASTLEKMRLAKLGRKASAETRAKMSASGKLAWLDPEIRRKRIDPRIGHTYSEETIQKMSRAALGRVIPAGQRAKIALTLTGKKQSAETRAKRSATLTKSWSDPKLRAAHGARMRERSSDPEYLKKLSDANKAAWARRKAAKLEAPDEQRNRGASDKFKLFYS